MTGELLARDEKAGEKNIRTLLFFSLYPSGLSFHLSTSNIPYKVLLHYWAGIRLFLLLVLVLPEVTRSSFLSRFECHVLPCLCVFFPPLTLLNPLKITVSLKYFHTNHLEWILLFPGPDWHNKGCLRWNSNHAIKSYAFSISQLHSPQFWFTFRLHVVARKLLVILYLQSSKLEFGENSFVLLLLRHWKGNPDIEVTSQSWSTCPKPESNFVARVMRCYK